MNRRRSGTLAMLAAAMSCICGCAEPDSPAGSPRFAASRSISAPGLSVSVFVSRQQLGVADRLELMVEARRDDQSARPIQWPPALADLAAGDAFPPPADASSPPEWTVLEVTRRTLAAGHESVEVILEPYLAGEKNVPAFAFAAAKQTLTTPAIPVVVNSESVPAAPDDDALAAVRNLGNPLLPPIPHEHWLSRPSSWAILGSAGVLVLAGGATAVGVVRARRRNLTPEQAFHRRLITIRAAAGSADPDVRTLCEQTISALRQWLASTRRVPLAATGPDLASWLRASGRPAATPLAERLSGLERARFAPSGRIAVAELQSLIDEATSYVDATQADGAVGEGGVPA